MDTKTQELAEQLAIICLKPETAQHAAAAYLAGDFAHLGNIIAATIKADCELWDKAEAATTPAAMEHLFGDVHAQLAGLGVRK